MTSREKRTRQMRELVSVRNAFVKLSGHNKRYPYRRHPAYVRAVQHVITFLASRDVELQDRIQSERGDPQ